MANPNPSVICTVTMVFTDIEESTRIWEDDPERMKPALARHDTISRATIEAHRGLVVKSTGDGVYAVFDDGLDALVATMDLQLALADPAATNGIPLRVRCGMHAGVVERRDNDYFGSPVNRAARIMGAAHGGQVLLSQTVADGVRKRLPASISLRDLGKVRLKDLATAEHLYQVVHAHLRNDFPPLRSLESTPNNLPQQITSFVGREKETAELRRLLSKSRMLTLTGSGGCGKTRLSLQLAADSLEHFADGAWCVEFAPVAEPGLVPQTIAHVLGLREDPRASMSQTVVEYLKEKQILLLLDNCEHLVASCAQVAEALLRQCPSVKIVATSREALGIDGEQTYRVPSLSLPDPSRVYTLEAISAFEAVQLFVERAQLARSDFQATGRNAAALASICCRLDGIALAIELAAARVRYLSVEEIDRKLGERFRLLTGGSRTALPRHQTLRALIDWSYDLLSEVERAVLCRLSVFAGGFTADAAEAVGNDVSRASDDVIDVLGHLVDKSLVAFDAREERYSLLETVRQYVQERLEESGQGAAARLAHMRYFAELARAATDDELIGPHQRTWQLRFEKERDNFFAMHAHAPDFDGGGAADLELAGMFRWLPLTQHGHWYRVVQEALAHPAVREPSGARCRALNSAAFLGYVLGHYSEARAFGEENLRIAGHLGDRQRLASAHNLLGMALLGEHSEKALPHLQAAYALVRESGDARWMAHAAAGLGEAYAAQGRYDLAEPYYLESLDHARAPGSAADTTANALLNLVLCDVARGDGGIALDHLREAIPLGDVGRSFRHAFAVVACCALVAPLLGDGVAAARMLGAIEASAQRHSVGMEPSSEAALAQAASRARALLDSDGFATAWAAGRTLDDATALAEACAWVEEKSR